MPIYYYVFLLLHFIFGIHSEQPAGYMSGYVIGSTCLLIDGILIGLSDFGKIRTSLSTGGSPFSPTRIAATSLHRASLYRCLSKSLSKPSSLVIDIFTTHGEDPFFNQNISSSFLTSYIIFSSNTISILPLFGKNLFM